jgi:hypothetical protein
MTFAEEHNTVETLKAIDALIQRIEAQVKSQESRIEQPGIRINGFLLKEREELILDRLQDASLHLGSAWELLHQTLPASLQKSVQ